ncbi:hypothetical protein SEVIR_3G017600v4 [Setaria viridis]|nr:uncharacterized protein LOC117847365 isoform X2 [Setaria viridis]TKW23904.1 hypothetical protein SEVIR_3G017600v2 [Setaria viridis]
MSSRQYRQTDYDKELDAMIIEAEEMVKENLSAFYSRGVPLVNICMALSFFAKMKYHEVSFTSPWTIMYLACLVVSFFTDMEMKMMFVTRQFRVRWMMAYLSTILQISAATALMLFFNTTDTVIVFALFGSVLVLVIYFFCQMLGQGKEPGLRWLHFKESLDRGFEMSALVVAPSVAGLSGKVLGYVKGSSDLTGGHMAVAPECFLFYSAVCGLLVVLFCTVPPSLSSKTDVIRRMAKVWIPGIAYIALLFLVVATVVAAEKILQEYVFLVCCGIAILALLCLCDAEGSSGLPTKDPPAQRSLHDVRQDEAKLSRYLFTAGISSILLAIMAIHSSYDGIGSGWSWKVFVGWGVFSILCHTVRIVILAQMTEIKRYESSRKFWTAWTCAAITITGLFALLVIYLHPDEVKNIF